MEQQEVTHCDGASHPGPVAPEGQPPRGGAGRKAGLIVYGLAAVGLAAVLLVLAGTCAFLLGRHAAAERPPFVARDVKGIQRPGKVFLVPLDNFPTTDLEELARQYAARYGTPVEVKPHTLTPPEAYDERREQLVAEDALAALRGAYPARRGEPQNVIIGVTADDMYIRGKDWQYAFSYRMMNAAVVSTARMDLPGSRFAARAGAERWRSRLRKMVAKNIGVLYYQLPLSNDPRSLLYHDIGGPQELDQMGEDF